MGNENTNSDIPEYLYALVFKTEKVASKWHAHNVLKGSRQVENVIFHKSSAEYNGMRTALSQIMGKNLHKFLFLWFPK